MWLRTCDTDYRRRRRNFWIYFSQKNCLLSFSSCCWSLSFENVRRQKQGWASQAILRVESSYFYHFFVFLFISIKNVNKKFFVIRSLLPSFYAQKDRIFSQKIKWYNHYSFINKIRTSKWTFLFNRTLHQNSKTVIFYQQKLNLNLFTSKKYLFIFKLRGKCVLITKIV